MVEEVTRKRDRRRLEPSEIAFELGHSKLINTRLQEVLKVAKRAFSISDSSGAMFKSLTDEISTEYPILQSLLNSILKDEDLSTPSDRELIFPRGILPALFAQGLIPGLFERSHIDEYFWRCRQESCAFITVSRQKDQVQTMLSFQNSEN